ncbi:hypothetical protein D3C80_1882570 [compost metagenome]
MSAEGAHLVGTGVRNAEDIFRHAVEQILDADSASQRRRPLRQLQATIGEQPPGRGVGCQETAVPGKRQQILTIDQDELAGSVEAEDVLCTVATQEVGIFDHPRVLLDQLQGK